MKAIIELHFYSGLPNPVWVVSGVAANNVLDAFDNLTMVDPGFQPVPNYKEPLGRPRSGYRGLTISFQNGEHRMIEVFNGFVLDPRSPRVLLDPLRRIEKYLFSLIPTQVVDEYLAGMKFEQVSDPGHEARIANLEAAPLELECKSAPRYQGDTGPFHTHRFINNCYNYATKVVNQVPLRHALPGTPNVRTPLTMAKLKAALKDDGLVDLGLALDGSCPPAGSHYVAVLLRRSPSGAVHDFHCLRLDRNGTWSHKDGKGEVRNVDDNGNVIVDLASAALSWQPELVGFYQFDAANSGRIG